MLYLVRLAETGREAQPKRSKLRRDVVRAILRRIPSAQVRSEVGRVLIETSGDETSALRCIHGVASFSPARRCSLDVLTASVLELADERLAPASTFRVRVKRVGDHPFTSQQLAAELGAAVCARTGRRVDLANPDLDIGVEVRARDCYVFDEVIPGADRRPRTQTRHGNRPAFLVDHMLGKLKVALRVLGYDTIYVRHEPDSAVIRRARAERRIVVTRDRALSQVPNLRAVFVESCEVTDQLAEVMRSLGLRPEREYMFTRCSLCNARVEQVDKASVRERLPGDVYRQYDEFTYCAPCDKLYWKGGQYDRLLDTVAPVLERRTV